MLCPHCHQRGLKRDGYDAVGCQCYHCRLGLPLPWYFGYGRGVTFSPWAPDHFSQYGTTVIPAAARDGSLPKIGGWEGRDSAQLLFMLDPSNLMAVVSK